MSRIVKYICDGCGKEIEKEPIRLQAEYVDAETGDFSMGPRGYYWENKKRDYCENCITQIIHFVNGPRRGMRESRQCRTRILKRRLRRWFHHPKKHQKKTDRQ